MCFALAIQNLLAQAFSTTGSVLNFFMLKIKNIWNQNFVQVLENQPVILDLEKFRLFLTIAKLHPCGRNLSITLP